DAAEEDSPYPEVRSAVANYDDPDMPASTLRAWVLGIFWAIVLPGMNQFFFFRYPSVSISGLVAQLVVYPFGRAWARFMPAVRICGISVNPGPFTIKEHVIVTVMAGVGAMSAYSTEIVAVQRVYYNTTILSSVHQWLLVMSTQLIGFSIGGITRRFLVAPPSMIWPNTLVQCALFNTLHSQSYRGIGSRAGTGLTREMYFLWVFVGALIWYFIPGYLFQALRWACWIAPQNVKVNQIFGYRSGFGFSTLTFDWNQIAFIGSPYVRRWAEANVAIGFVFFYWFLAPILYYKNAWSSQYLPVSAISAYDNTGSPYNHTRILNAQGDGIDLAAYHAYSPVYLPITFTISYGLSFLSIAATIPHALLYFSKPIMIHFKRSLREPPDVHARLMKSYPQIPEWHYAVIFCITFTFSCLCIQLWPGGMTIWALVIALIVGVIYVIPIGMIQAVTNRQIGLNVITELIVGFMIPGRPTAMMMFTYGYITMSQAMQFTTDLKLGHYMKIPPRPMFWCQVVSTVIAGTVQLGVQSWMFSNIPDICSPYQKDNFTCSSTHVFATASVIWGLIGPGLQFAKGQAYLYVALLFFFIIGAVCPIILWAVTRRWPNTILNYLKYVLIFAGTEMLPPAGAVNYVPWVIVGFVFQYLVRRRNFPYWAKYNYVLSAALDAGTGVGVILVFFCLQFPRNGNVGTSTIQQWWGNTVHKRTYDWNQVPLRTLAPGQKFG
ncbi:small oligopeptide transporter, partial [Hymenopellis radicata]